MSEMCICHVLLKQIPECISQIYTDDLSEILPSACCLVFISG